jgi:CheY-like chemotaxis protein
MVSSAKRIICVDDSGDDCELFHFILTRVGYAVESAQTFQEALQLIEKGQFDLCLTDISLDGGTGFELLERVHALNPAIPLVVCSADARDATRERALQAGVRAFFTKPIDCDALVDTITRLVA